MPMTWREVLEDLQNRDPRDPHLDDTATVYVTEIDEYFAIDALTEDEEGGVLDPGHLVLTTEAAERPQPVRDGRWLV